MARRSRPIRLDAPYLRRAWLDLPADADRFFEERCSRQGVYYFDEPESALHPRGRSSF